MKNKITLSQFLFGAFLTLVAIWPALYNQFPLVTPDTGSYIYSGIRLSMGVDRLWGYGIFLLLTSWGISLWGPVLVQGAIFSWLIHELCSKTLKDKASRPVVALITLLVTFGTSAAWFNSQLMADAFSGLLLIAVLLLFIGDENKKKTFLLGAFVLCTLLTHSSHVVITLLMSVILFFYFRRKKLQHSVKVARKLFLLASAAIVLTCTAYAIGGYGFRFSPVSHMFLMSRMAENGILDRYLEAHCATEHLSLCDYKGKTGNRQWDFMWVGNYPHSREHGWIDTRKEYNEIIYGSLRSPKFLGMHIVKNTEAGLRQLGQIYVGDGIDQRNPEGSSPYTNIDQYFPQEIKEFRSSVQNSGQLPFGPVNFIITLFAVLAGIAALFIQQRESRKQSVDSSVGWMMLFGIVILFIVLNAFVTATFSTIIARLEARVFWVLPLLCVLYVYDRLNSRKRVTDPL